MICWPNTRREGTPLFRPLDLMENRFGSELTPRIIGLRIVRSRSSDLLTFIFGRYSERHREHWFYGGKDGLSITGTDGLPIFSPNLTQPAPIERTIAKNDTDRDKPQPNIRGDTVDDLQVRKLITGNGGDKPTIRGVTNPKVV